MALTLRDDRDRVPDLGALPRRVGHYRLVALLGRGGMGEVYRAYDRRLGRDVAVKHVLPERAGNPTAHARIEREARSLARLSHPAIVPVFDLIEDDEGAWIVMELVEGPSLDTLLASGPLALDRALDYGHQIALGLAEAHARGILHRDLKSENVLIAPTGHARIVDFGLAKPLWRDEDEATLSVAGAILGTCRAMAPEQARGLATDHRSDLFSFGVLLYEMLSGQSPFLANTNVDTLGRVCTHHPPAVARLIPAVPQAVSDLVGRLLEKAPERRPQSADEVAVTLEHLRAAERSAASTGDGDLAESKTEVALHRAEAIPPETIPPETIPPETISSEAIPPEVTAPQSSAPEIAAATPVRSAQATSASGWRGRLVGLAAVLLIGLLVAVFFALPNRSGSPETAVDLAESDPYAAIRQGLALLERHDKQGHVDRAIQSFRRAVVLDPVSAPAYAGLARAYWLRFGRGSRDHQWLTLALPAAERAVELDPYLATASVSLGLVHVALGRHEEAEDALQRASKLDPGSADAHYGLGQLYLAQNRFEDAEASYDLALALRPDDPWLLDHLGVLYFRTQRLATAAATFRRSIALRPDSAYAHRNLGAVLQMQGRLTEAAAAMQRALEIRPEAGLYTNLGVLFFTQGMYGEAADAFERALDMGTMSHSSQAWANLADAYRWLPGREGEARDAYLRAIQLVRADLESNPDDVTHRSRLAHYLAKRGERSAALAEVEQVAPMAREDAAALYRLAVTLEILAERDRALQTLEAALAAGYPLRAAEADPELLELRADPAFHRTVAHFEVPATD